MRGGAQRKFRALSAGALQERTAPRRIFGPNGSGAGLKPGAYNVARRGAVVTALFVVEGDHGVDRSGAAGGEEARGDGYCGKQGRG